MTKPKAAAPPKAAAARRPAVHRPAPPRDDAHADHVTIHSAVWNEATGVAEPIRLCSCGERRLLEG